MTLRNTLIQSVRTWAKATIGLTDAQIVPVQKGPNKHMRLPLPYLTVNITRSDDEQGTDWTVYELTQTRHRGNRTATVRLMGYGEETADWLVELGMRLDAYNVIGTLTNLMGGVIDVSQQVSESIEPQYAKDFRLDYLMELSLTGDDNPTVYADTFIIDVNSEDGLVQQHLEV
jgi:hypothetical protein